MASNANFLNSVRVDTPNRNYHDLTHEHKTTLDMGNLVPICCMEVVPGDKFQISGKALVRFMPLASPAMHRFDVSIHYFFVPNRILWDKWEDYIVGKESIAPPSMFFDREFFDSHRLLDYFGLNPHDGDPEDDITISPMALAAYQCVYNEWYRDQNLVNEVNYKLVNGEVPEGQREQLCTLRKRAWEHDMFTAALPFAQAGAPVDVPLGKGTVELDSALGAGGVIRKAGDHTLAGNGALQTGGTGFPAGGFNNTVDATVYDPNGSLTVNTEATTINSLRRAFALQRWLEKGARAGRRYVEWLKAIFNVSSSDARMQRPEYITGTKSPVIISEVLNTTGEIAEGGLPQGTMAGHGVSVTTGKFGEKFCEEHGYIIGIMSVMPRTAYMQGVPRHFIKREVTDYLIPDFENIGEQEVYNMEVYANSSDPYGTFGYMPRYAQYRYIPSFTTGNFKNNLKFWTLTREFDTEPALNSDFIQCDPGKRIFAVEDPEQDSIVVQVLNTVGAVRPLSKYGTPI